MGKEGHALNSRLSCKANARVNLAKTGHGPHSPKLLLCCSMYCLFCVVLCIVCVYMCTVLLPSGDNPIAVNKYIISYQFYKKCIQFLATKDACLNYVPSTCRHCGIALARMSSEAPQYPQTELCEVPNSRQSPADSIKASLM